ncbi:MAG: hypothetical protein WBD64_12325 [Candidatus Zixiibacteriota bacterium]
MVSAGKVLLAIRNPRLFSVKLYNYVKKRFYVNETLVLFRHKVMTEQRAPVEIRYASPETIADILSFQPERYVKVFEEFLSSGDRGYFAYLNGRCVHRSWVKHAPQIVHLHPCLPMRLKEDEAFIHYCETAPEARRNNIYPYVLTKIVDDFKDRKKIFVSVNAKNVASMKGVEKAGFREARRWKLLVVLGIRIKPFRMLVSVV